MGRQIYVNLAVRDLERAKKFFSELGFTFNPQFTDKNAACMIIADDSYVMLLVEPFFKSFIKKSLVDAKASTEVLVALSAGSREEVDEMIRNAIAAGGSEVRDPEDHGWMYSRAFEDLDGHIWEVVCMDMAKLPR